MLPLPRLISLAPREAHRR